MPDSIAAQPHQMKDEELFAALERSDEGPKVWPPIEGIRTAAKAWCEDPAAAKARYGPIASWDTSRVTDLKMLFFRELDFNEDISRWNVSNVVRMDAMFEDAASFNCDLSGWDVGQVEQMDCMFSGATSFNGDLSCWDVSSVWDMDEMFDGATSFSHQLCGEWSFSMADKINMFRNSPGSIAGMRKDADGTVE